MNSLKFAVIYGTITLDSGEVVTYSANDIATFYNVQDLPYVPVPLVGQSPFTGKEEIEYIRLIPRGDGVYYDAKERYNIDDEPYLDDDFDAKEGGKWAVKPRVADNDGN